MKDMLQHYLSRFNHPGIKRYSRSAIWLILEKISTMILGLFVGVWVARYLGPEEFGLLNYVFAFVGLFAPISYLGIQGIISRDLVKDREDTNILLSTGFIMRICGSLILLIFVVSYFYFFKREPIYLSLAIIAAFQYLLTSSEIIELYYVANINTKYIFISKFIGNILSSVTKVLFILMGCNVVYFGISRISLVFFTTIFLFYFFKKENHYVSLKFFKLKKGKELLKESWPLIFSGVFAIIYMQIDKIMIGEMLDNHAVGQYSVAVSLSSLWFFLPMLIRKSILPAFVNARKKDIDLYNNRLKIVFSIMALIAYVIIIPISLLSNTIINILYGVNYLAASNVLSIHIFCLLFFFIGIGRGLWIVNESYFKFDLLNNIGAGILNIILNFFLLPKLGIIGAAYATLVSYSFTFFFGNLLFKPARKIFLMQLRALLLLDLFRVKKYF
jgi:O-antigen/teichoic acid export membrane protein